jgi:glycine hydroxymethyltransferase
MIDSRLSLTQNDSKLNDILLAEEKRQSESFTLIASENHTDPEILALLGSVLTDKYSEGYPERRYYGGQAQYDALESLARERACQLFRAEHANVQPLLGSPMNQVVYLGLLKPGDAILAMDLSHGGHLTHGDPVSHMGRLFRFVRYKTSSDGSIDFGAVRRSALAHHPK